MKCRFCNAEINETHKICPKCGKKEPQPEKNPAFFAMRRTAIMYGCIAALAVLAVVLFIAMNAGWDLGDGFGWLKPKQNDVYRKKSYTVSDKKAYRNREEIVATMGDATLNNGQVQIYYWMQVYEFVSNYSDSLAYLGLDYTAALDQQLSTDGETTWQQYFLESAMQVWQTNQAFALLAEQNGFAMTEEDQLYLDNLEENLEKTARESGFASADEMVQAELGAGCNAADYAAYLRVYFLAYQYFSSLYDQIDPTQEEIEAYYLENLERFENAGIEKSDAIYVDVRQILITPEGGTILADGSVVYTETAWDQCKSDAEQVLTAWERGEKTEEAFIALVALHSDDATTSSTGGLYTDLVKGDMEDAYDNWCFGTTRQSGEYGMVKTSYGYHIVYFVEAEEIWYAEARAALREVLGQEMVDEVLADYPMTVDYKKIVLAEMNMTK